MRISDWSSDVCSSDLIALLDGGERTASVTATSAGSALQLGRNALKDFAASHPEFAWSLMQQLARRLRTADQTIESDRAYASGPRQIGSASCRERVCQYVSISVVAGS